MRVTTMRMSCLVTKWKKEEVADLMEMSRRLMMVACLSLLTLDRCFSFSLILVDFFAQSSNIANILSQLMMPEDLSISPHGLYKSYFLLEF